MRAPSVLAERTRVVPALVLASLLVASGCGGEREQPTGGASESAPPASPTPPEPGAAPSEAPSADGAGGVAAGPSGAGTSATGGAGGDVPAPADACERAQACCPAYVAALPPSGRGEAGEACNTLSLAMELEGRPRDEACQGALEGFRASLVATGLEVPEACR